MAQKDRETLKTYFSKGRRPSQEEFADLIDSTLNIIDHGFDKTPHDGFRIAQLGSSSSLQSFYQDITIKSPLWRLRLDPVTSSLIYEGVKEGDGENEIVLTLNPTGKVGIRNKYPNHELDVIGTIATNGRIGQEGVKQVAANGIWQDITEDLDGCRAYEIIAGVGGAKGSGKYALMHAFALSTYNGKNKITYHQAHYGSRCNRLKLQWVGNTHKYKLQLKTACDYKEDLNVKYYITELWFDPFMEAAKGK